MDDIEAKATQVLVHSRANEDHSQTGALAYQRLRQMIVSLQLEPGSRVDELSLSELTGFGRTPIREALQRLAQDHLVSIFPRKGTLIAPINIAELREVEELRWELESLAARWAAERATTAQLDELEELITRAQSGAFSSHDNWDLELDRHFHMLLARATGNRYIVGTIERLYNHSLRLFYASKATMADAAEELEDYEGIIASLRARDAAAAAHGMRNHLLDSRRRVTEALGYAFGRREVKRGTD